MLFRFLKYASFSFDLFHVHAMDTGDITTVNWENNTMVLISWDFSSLFWTQSPM